MAGNPEIIHLTAIGHRGDTLTLTLGLWAFLGFPLVVIDIFVLQDLTRSRLAILQTSLLYCERTCTSVQKNASEIKRCP